MNERIKELADKAIEDMPGAWNIPDEFCDKFAELIVEECVELLSSRQGFSSVQGRIMRIAGAKLKQHFDFGGEE